MLTAMIIAQQSGGTIVREVNSAAITICEIPPTFGLAVTTIECTNVNRRRGEDALLAQRERLIFICNKNSEIVKKCNDKARLLRFRPIDEDERSFFKEELKWLMYSVKS